MYSSDSSYSSDGELTAWKPKILPSTEESAEEFMNKFYKDLNVNEQYREDEMKKYHEEYVLCLFP